MVRFRSLKHFVQRLRADKSGISLVEFALVLPILLTLGLYGTEIARMSTTKILRGAIRQGESIDLEENGRIILSSLEYDDPSDRQFISWQRCIGDDDSRTSKYGDDEDNNGLNGDELEGMGEGGKQITALSGSAVMFVEIHYKYEALWDDPFGSGDGRFYHEAAFLIRDDRNLDPGLVGTQNSDTQC